MSTRAAAAQTDGGGNHDAGDGLGFTPGADDDDSLIDAFEEAIELSDEDAEDFEQPTGRKKDKANGKKGKDADRRRARDDDDADDEGDGAQARGEDDDDAEDDGEDQDGEEDDETPGRKKAKADDDESDGDEGEDLAEDYVEDEETGEKITVSSLLEARKFQREFASHRDQVLARVETEAKARAETAHKDLEGKVKEMGDTLELLKALAPKLDDPPTTMLDKSHEDYDPDTYHTLVRMKQQVEGVLEKARTSVAAAKTDAETKAKERFEAYVKGEGDKLVKAFPEWGDPQKAPKLSAELTSFLKTTYGMDDSLINRLIDHRLFKVAFDAQKLHALKKKGAAKVEAERKPARLVRSRERPTPTREGRPGRAGKKGALDRLERTGKVRETDLEEVWGEFL